MSLFPNLQKPLNLRGLTLKNRVILSSMTRNRGLIPNSDFIEYYAQRSSAGLLLTEGILIEPQGTEWPDAPGIWDKEQIEGWKKVVNEVHNKDGKIFAQLWHVGRAAHKLHNCGIPPPSASNVTANGGTFRLLVGRPGYSQPKAIERPSDYVELFKKAAINAKSAGFDGIELHNANGYLPHQFLESHSNLRTDDYGGSIKNRCRFTLEIIDRFIEIYGKDRVGIKLSPCGGYNDMGEKNENELFELYSYLISELDKREIAYIQLVRYNAESDPVNRGLSFNVEKFFPLIKNSNIFINMAFDAEEGDRYIKEGKVHGIVYGRPFISNPDLPERFFNGYPLATIQDFSTLYNVKDGNIKIGYTDYPRYSKE